MHVNNKIVFLEALIVTLLVFGVGILLGISFEKAKIEKAEEHYFDLETDVFDLENSLEIIYGGEINCTNVNAQAVYFADKIYDEAVRLEMYDHSNKLTSEVIFLHRRYDLLRAILWADLIVAKEECKDSMNTVVYTYQYEEPSLTIRGTQMTMSNFLIELKKEYGEDLILIPIAYDLQIDSLDLLREKYGLKDEPTIFVNEEYVLTDLDFLEEVESYLN